MTSNNIYTRPLTGRHHRAIALILEGNRDVDIARIIKVAPETISRWRHNNELFKQELELQRSRINKVLEEKHIQLAFRALQIIEDSLDGYDPKIAIAFLKIIHRDVIPGIQNESLNQVSG